MKHTLYVWLVALLVISLAPVQALSMPAEDAATSGKPFDAIAIQMQQGDTKKIDSNVWLTYVETERQNKKVCERFTLTYTDLPAAPVKKTTPAKVTVTAVPLAEIAPKETAVDAVTALIEASKKATVKNPDPLLDIVEPGAVEKDIVGASTVATIVVDADALEAVAVVEPTKPEQVKIDSLFDRVATLARDIGREEYILFTTNEDKVAEALVKFLHKKGFYLDAGRNGWQADVQKFVDYNKINLVTFDRDLRLAQKELVLAQLYTYNALLLLMHGKQDAAEMAYNNAVDHYKKYQAPIDRLNTEMHRWKLPVEYRETLCVALGETIPPLTVQQKDDRDRTVTVIYNPLAVPAPAPEPIVSVEAVEPTTVDEKTLTKTKTPERNTCVVDGEKVPIGTRMNGQYCDVTKNMQDQKADGDAAENSYECLSNESRNGICVNSLNILERLWRGFLRLFGIFR